MSLKIKQNKLKILTFVFISSMYSYVLYLSSYFCFNLSNASKVKMVKYICTGGFSAFQFWT